MSQITTASVQAAIDGFITAFFAFARAVLAPVAVLIAFFAAVKAIIILLPFVGAFVPAFLNKAVGVEMIATGILCALASGK
jgi:hypothetical protein